MWFLLIAMVAWGGSPTGLILTVPDTSVADEPAHLAPDMAAAVRRAAADTREASRLRDATYDALEAAWEAGVSTPTLDDEAPWRSAMQRAVQRWDEALTRPDASRDAALHASALEQRASALRDLGRVAEAVAAWEVLVRDHPGSPPGLRAALELAEHTFAVGDMTTAAARYATLTEATDSVIRRYASYKLAWCRLNQGDPAAALASLRALAGDDDAGPIRDAARHDALIVAAGALGRDDALRVVDDVCADDADCRATGLRLVHGQP